MPNNLNLAFFKGV